MHNFRFGCEDGRAVSFNYNSDLSGDVWIKVSTSLQRTERLRVPCRALLEFIANHVREVKVSKLEAMEPLSILYRE